MRKLTKILAVAAIAGAAALPLHRGVELARRIAAAVDPDSGAVDRGGCAVQPLPAGALCGPAARHDGRDQCRLDRVHAVHVQPLHPATAGGRRR